MVSNTRLEFCFPRAFYYNFIDFGLVTMSHNIYITNLSGHAQEFEIHGWNNNQNMTVPARQTSVVSAKDGSSGAIIALHYGFEGEQAEITKDGFGGKQNEY